MVLAVCNSDFEKAVFSGYAEYSRIGLLQLGTAHVLHLLLDPTVIFGRNLFPVATRREVCLHSTARIQVHYNTWPEAVNDRLWERGTRPEMSTLGSNILPCALLGRFLKRWLAGDERLLELCAQKLARTGVSCHALYRNNHAQSTRADGCF